MTDAARALSDEPEPFRPFEVVNEAGDPGLLLLCDHASNAMPPGYGGLGVAAEDLERHIGYDVGARGVTLALSRMLDCPAVLSRFSRLFVDPNRGEDDPTLIMKLSDGSRIPGNRVVSPEETERRLDLCYRPYHAAIETAIQRARERSGSDPAIVSIHSFTPRMRGRAERPWHVSVLWDSDAETARALLGRLRRDPDLCVGENEPYGGGLEGDCLWRHATRAGLRNVLLEIRNDLIETEIGQLEWATKLAVSLRDVL